MFICHCIAMLECLSHNLWRDPPLSVSSLHRVWAVSRPPLPYSPVRSGSESDGCVTLHFTGPVAELSTHLCPHPGQGRQGRAEGGR